MFIFWVYFFVPLLIGSTVSGFTTMLITLVIYQAAYLAEVIRAGIEGLPGGQSEAARALGMSYMQTIVKIILPQALYNMLPAMVSQFVSTIKETSLGYVISVNELTFAANQVNSTLLTKPFPVFMLLALIYFLLCFTLSQFAHFLERRITNKRAGSGNKKAAEPDLNLVLAQAVE
jgi:polar amino acid transport system permease protein